MSNILTPDQIECIKEQWSELAETCPWDELLDSHAALRTDRDAWEATAKGYHARLAEVQQELRMGNVLYAQLTDRVNDKEQELAEVQADVLALVKFISSRSIHKSANINCEHCVEVKNKLLARPGVVRLLKGETP